MPGSGQEGNLPACSIVQTNPPTAATGLDNMRHRGGWAREWVVLWLQGWMCDVRHISIVPYFFILQFSIPTSPQHIAKVFFVPYTEKPPQTIWTVALAHISCLLNPGPYGSIKLWLPLLRIWQLICRRSNASPYTPNNLLSLSRMHVWQKPKRRIIFMMAAA